MSLADDLRARARAFAPAALELAAFQRTEPWRRLQALIARWRDDAEVGLVDLHWPPRPLDALVEAAERVVHKLPVDRPDTLLEWLLMHAIDVGIALEPPRSVSSSSTVRR